MSPQKLCAECRAEIAGNGHQTGGVQCLQVQLARLEALVRADRAPKGCGLEGWREIAFWWRGAAGRAEELNTRLVGLGRRQLLREAALLDALLTIAAEPTRHVHARANAAIADQQAQLRRDVEAFGDLPPPASDNVPDCKQGNDEPGGDAQPSASGSPGSGGGVSGFESSDPAASGKSPGSSESDAWSTGAPR